MKNTKKPAISDYTLDPNTLKYYIKQMTNSLINLPSFPLVHWNCYWKNVNFSVAIKERDKAYIVIKKVP